MKTARTPRLFHMATRPILAVMLTACLSLTASHDAYAQFKQRTLRMAANFTQSHSMRHGMDAMAACLRAGSGEKLAMRMFWDGVLGAEMNTLQSLRTGTIDMVPTTTAPIATIVPALGVFDLPFLFNTAEEADQVLDGKVGDWFADQLPEKGLVVLAWWENGFRHLTNSRRPIHKLADFAGVRMRVMQSSVFLDTFQALGSNAVPMSYSEVYSALETKTVDGQENPLNNIEDMKFYEVQKYLTLSRHAYSPAALLFSKKTWDGLSAQEQTLLRTCAVTGRDAQRQASRAMEAKGEASLRAKGMQVSEISPADMAQIRQATQTIYARYATIIGQEAISRVTDELQRIRNR